MSIETRPTDLVTPSNLLIGMPFVEFAVSSGGVIQPYQAVGVVDSAELAKALETVTLESAQSGVRVLLRELPTRVLPQLNIGIYNFSADILRYTLGSSVKTSIAAASAAVVTDDPVQTTTDPLDFLDLAHTGLNAGSVVVTPATVTAEQVGVGDGTKGAISGDYALK